jgi:hypothetical protein
MFGGGGFGYFLTESRYLLTASSAGPAVQPKSAPTTRSSWGSIFDVIDPRVTGHWRARREHAWLALRSDAGRMDVGEVDPPLLPTRGDEVAANEHQQAVAVASLALTEQHFGLVHAIDRPVARHRHADDAGGLPFGLKFRASRASGALPNPYSATTMRIIAKSLVFNMGSIIWKKRISSRRRAGNVRESAPKTVAAESAATEAATEDAVTRAAEATTAETGESAPSVFAGTARLGFAVGP